MPQVNHTHVVEIRHKGLLANQEIINIFYYGTTAAPASHAALEASFKTVLYPTWKLIVTANYSFKEITIQEVLGGSAFTIFPETDIGSISDQNLPPHDAWAFTYVRGGLGERNGYKRICAVPETFQDGGSFTPSAKTARDNFAAALASDLNDGVNAWHPTIRRDMINHVVQIPPKWFSISYVKGSDFVSTQNSRKFGHGR